MYPLPQALEEAKKLAKEAGRQILDLYQKKMVISHKPDASIVTEADTLADQIIRKGLQKHFTEWMILSEESTDQFVAGVVSDYVWVVDPLDGTKAYAKGIPGFSVMIGLLHHGKPCLGVVYDPLNEYLYFAIKDQGAFIQKGNAEEHSLHVSKRDDLAHMPLIISTGFPENKLALLQEKLPGPLCPPINSVGIKVGVLVRQEGDIYMNHHEVHYWDTCAPEIILHEAGGSLTDLEGKPLVYELASPSKDHPWNHQKKTLATNGTRHEKVRQLLVSIFHL